MCVGGRGKGTRVTVIIGNGKRWLRLNPPTGCVWAYLLRIESVMRVSVVDLSEVAVDVGVVVVVVSISGVSHLVVD
jgi:hypothetical protein